MKTLVSGLVCALALAGCAATEGAEQDDARDENVATVDQPMKWTPRDESWYSCLVGLQICRCSGNIIDCREPIDIVKLPTATATAP